jgi:hypothetical protein
MNPDWSGKKSPSRLNSGQNEQSRSWASSNLATCLEATSRNGLKLGDIMVNTHWDIHKIAIWIMKMVINQEVSGVLTLNFSMPNGEVFFADARWRSRSLKLEVWRQNLMFHIPCQVRVSRFKKNCNCATQHSEPSDFRVLHSLPTSTSTDIFSSALWAWIHMQRMSETM